MKTTHDAHLGRLTSLLHGAIDDNNDRPALAPAQDIHTLQPKSGLQRCNITNSVIATQKKHHENEIARNDGIFIVINILYN